MLNSEKAMFALNDMDDSWLESAQIRLGYQADGRTQIRKRKFWRTLLIAAVLTSLLAATAYAADFLGIRALVLEDKQAQILTEDESGSLSWQNNPEGAVISITQPQGVPDTLSLEIRKQVENSRKAWDEWQTWHEENGLRWPAVFDGPERTSFVNMEEQEDGGVILSFYARPETPADPDVSLAHMEQGDYSDFILLEKRTASKEEYEQYKTAMDAISMGYSGYDFNYNVYTKEEAEKLEEIAAKYKLEIRREQKTTFGSHADYLKVYDLPEGMDRETWLSLDYQSSGTAMQLKMLSEDTSHGEVFRRAPDYIDHLYYFQEGSFGISGAERLNGRTVSFYLYNSMYHTLSSGLEVTNWIRDVSTFSARTYTAADGTELTVLSSGKAGDMVYLYTYLDDSFLVMTLESDIVLTDDEINSMAEEINYSEIRA